VPIEFAFDLNIGDTISVQLLQAFLIVEPMNRICVFALTGPAGLAHCQHQPMSSNVFAVRELQNVRKPFKLSRQG
jgi:hypothetical protein